MSESIYRAMETAAGGEPSPVPPRPIADCGWERPRIQTTPAAMSTGDSVWTNTPAVVSPQCATRSNTRNPGECLSDWRTCGRQYNSVGQSLAWSCSAPCLYLGDARRERDRSAPGSSRLDDREHQRERRPLLLGEEGRLPRTRRERDASSRCSRRLPRRHAARRYFRGAHRHREGPASSSPASTAPSPQPANCHLAVTPSDRSELVKDLRLLASIRLPAPRTHRLDLTLPPT